VAFPNLTSRNCRGNVTFIVTFSSILLITKKMAAERSFEPELPFRRKISKVGEGRGVMALSLNGRIADAVFLDPPYNVAIDGHRTTPGLIAFTRSLCSFRSALKPTYRRPRPQILQDLRELTLIRCSRSAGESGFVCVIWWPTLSPGFGAIQRLCQACPTRRKA
jgi:hypothetical protein